MCVDAGTGQVLMTTQTERENARYRKDVEKAGLSESPSGRFLAQAAEKLRPRSRSRRVRPA